MTADVAVRLLGGQDFYVPHFQVRIAGRPAVLSVVRDILQVSYKDNLDNLDSFELTINNWDAEQRDFKYSDSDLFDPGKEFELWMGYHGVDPLRLMVHGEITSLRPSFPSGGGSTLVVSGLNILHKLQTQEQSVTYVDKTDSDIAREIADRLKIDIRTDAPASEVKYDYVLQENQSDIIFLLNRARRMGYDLYVEEKGTDGASIPPRLVFARSTNVRKRTYELRYGRTLIDFKPDLTTSHQVAEVVVKGWDPINKKRIEATATRSEIAAKGIGEQAGQKKVEQAFKERRTIIPTQVVNTEQEAKLVAVRALEENAKDLVRATASTVGLPDLRAGCAVDITGVGVRFSGRYFVTATTHAMGDSGYTTSFECRREEVA